MEWIIIAWLAVVTAGLIYTWLVVWNLVNDCVEKDDVTALAKHLGYTYSPPTTTEFPARWVKKGDKK